MTQNLEIASSEFKPPILSTVEQFCGRHRFKNQAGLRGEILNAEDRKNSRGERIPGNGLAEAGAIVRIGRRVYIDEEKYFKWVADQQPRPRAAHQYEQTRAARKVAA